MKRPFPLLQYSSFSIVTKEFQIFTLKEKNSPIIILPELSYKKEFEIYLLHFFPFFLFFSCSFSPIFRFQHLL